MSQNFQETKQIILRSQRIIILAKNNKLDNIVSALSLLIFLKSEKIKSDLIIPDLDKNKLPSILENTDLIQTEVSSIRDLKISINLNHVPVHELSYSKENDKLNIIITPKIKEWKAEDVSIDYQKDKYDLIISIGFQTRQDLQKSLKQNSDFIHRLPIINIDYKPSNAHWGIINLLDLNSVSITENIYNWLRVWNKSKITPQLATNLLMGMIINTESFRTNNISPLTLQHAGELIKLGAKRQEIIQNIWRTKPINTLKLWGQALYRLEYDQQKQIIWTTLTKEDIINNNVNDIRLDDLVNELIKHAPNVKYIAIFNEYENQQTRLIVFALPPHDIQHISHHLDLKQTDNKAHGLIQKPIIEAKEYALEIIKKII